MGLRRLHRKDTNSDELVEFARELGIVIEYIGRPTDVLAGWRNRWYVAELKHKDGKYTPAQEKFRRTCTAFNLPFLTWRTPEDIVAFANG